MAFAPIINGTYIVELTAEGEVAGGVDYACQVAEVVVEAAAGDTTTFQPLCEGAAYTSVKPTEWSMTLNYAQDFAAGGLALWLYENDGKAFTGLLSPYGVPASATAPSFTLSGRVVAGPIGGGPKGEFALGETQMPLDGKPVLVVVPPALLAAEAAEAPAANGKAKAA